MRAAQAGPVRCADVTGLQARRLPVASWPLTGALDWPRPDTVRLLSPNPGCRG